MSELPFDRERLAYDAFQRLMGEADKTWRLFRDAGIPLPPPLARMMGDMDGMKPALKQTKAAIPPIEVPPRPAEAEADWIWVPYSDLLVAQLVLGILRGAGSPMSAAEIAERAGKLREGVNTGSVYNTGPRLEEAKIIARDDSGWRLLDTRKSPVLHEGYAWGPLGVFQTQEVAAHRRLFIKHVLNAFPTGVMMMDLLAHLKDIRNLRVPVEKDFVKGDLEAMQADRVVTRRSNTRKWVVRTTNE